MLLNKKIKDINILLKNFNISPLFYNFIIETLPELNIDTTRLEKLTRFKIKKTPKERVSLIKMYRLWTSIEKLTKRSDIGIAFADKFTFSKAGIIGTLFFNSENLKESTFIMKRFLPIIINNISIEYEEDGQYSIFYFNMAPKFLIPFSALECYIKICYNWAREYTGLNSLPVEEINYIYKKPEHFAYYKKTFPKTKIFFNQPKNYIVLKKDIFYIKNKRKITTSYSFIIKQAEEIKKHIYFQYDFTQIVTNKILLTLPEGKNSIEYIAKELKTSPSTIKRKLRKENTSFSDLTENIRKKLAYMLIKDTDYSFEEISYLLGYSQYSSFFRAFKKWFKHPPSFYRETVIK